MFYQPNSQERLFFNSQRVVGEDSNVAFYINVHEKAHVYKNAIIAREDNKGGLNFYENTEVFDTLPENIQKELVDYCMLLEENFQIELA